VHGLYNQELILTTSVLEIIHGPVSYLKQNVSETEICLRLHVEPTQMRPVSGDRPEM
jgi:hypothetical protein